MSKGGTVRSSPLSLCTLGYFELPLNWCLAAQDTIIKLKTRRKTNNCLPFGIESNKSAILIQLAASSKGVAMDINARRDK